MQEYGKIPNFVICLHSYCLINLLLLNKLCKIHFFENLTVEMDSTSKITEGMTVSSMIIQFVN